MKDYLICAMDIGEQMLLNGAEVHRVEDSVERMCKAFGAVRTDIFIITSSMILTVTDTDGNVYTQTRRVTSSGTDFERLHRLNELSRAICSKNMSLDEIRTQFNSILECKTYPFWLRCVATATIGFAFTLFFGGGIVEALVSLLIGAVVSFVTLFADNASLNKIFSKFLCSFIATALAVVAVKAGIVPTVDKIIIGNIMVLIPGIGFTNALRDLFIGDSIAGLLRTIEAVLVALAIAAGYVLFVFITGGAM